MSSEALHDPELAVLCRLYPEHLTPRELAIFTEAARELPGVRLALEGDAIAFIRKARVARASAAR